MIRKQMVQPLETERLQLRGWKRSDAPQLYAYASNPNVGPKAGWKPHESIAESRKIIETVFRESRVWAIIEKTGGRIIGSIGLSEDRLRPGVRSLELGYSLAEEFWGHGLMTEAHRIRIRIRGPRCHDDPHRGRKHRQPAHHRKMRISVRGHSQTHLQDL